MLNQVTLGFSYIQKGAATFNQEDVIKDKARYNDLNTNHNKDE